MNLLNYWLPSRGSVLFTLLVATGLFLYVQNISASLTSRPPNQTSTQVMTYQGRLTNASGESLTGNYPITFKLYPAASGGSELWSESWPAVAVQEGLFNVLLGSITPLTPDLITTNNSLWLGVQVGSDAEMTPRVQLGAVPFAIQSLVVPTGAITTTMLADGAVTSAKLAPVVKIVQNDNVTFGTTDTSQFVDLPGAVITLTVNDVSSDSTLLVFFEGTFRNISGDGTWARIVVNTAEASLVLPTASTDWDVIPINSIHHVSPGNHVIKAQFRPVNGGTSEIADYSLIVLVVSEP